jgi:hypothetical protein
MCFLIPSSDLGFVARRLLVARSHLLVLSSQSLVAWHSICGAIFNPCPCRRLADYSPGSRGSHRQCLGQSPRLLCPVLSLRLLSRSLSAQPRSSHPLVVSRLFPSCVLRSHRSRHVLGLALGKLSCRVLDSVAGVRRACVACASSAALCVHVRLSGVPAVCAATRAVSLCRTSYGIVVVAVACFSDSLGRVSKYSHPSLPLYLIIYIMY